MNKKLVFAVPKGRILDELVPILNRAQIIPEDDFFSKESRKLRFSTNLNNLDIVRVRSFDVATFVNFGAAAIGVAGSDVFAEFVIENVYTLFDLGIGKCRMSVAAKVDLKDNLSHLSHLRIATKYPKTTSEFFAKMGIQAECIKLNGAMELAPTLGLCSRIVDLVSTGATLKANGLVETQKIADVSSKLIVNRTALKTRSNEINDIVERIRGSL